MNIRIALSVPVLVRTSVAVPVIQMRTRLPVWEVHMKVVLFALLLCSTALPADIRLGIIGTDTSHAVVFTGMFNDPAAKNHVAGARVVAAFKGGSPDIPSSWTRVDKYAEELRTEWGIELVADIPTLCQKVDAILLESNDGRIHLAQARLVIAAHKPLFIDKPMASTLEDAREIARLAREAGVPMFSSSSLRFERIATAMKFPDTKGVIRLGPRPCSKSTSWTLPGTPFIRSNCYLLSWGRGARKLPACPPQMPMTSWAAGKTAGSAACERSVRTVTRVR